MAIACASSACRCASSCTRHAADSDELTPAAWTRLPSNMTHARAHAARAQNVRGQQGGPTSVGPRDSGRLGPLMGTRGYLPPPSLPAPQPRAALARAALAGACAAAVSAAARTCASAARSHPPARRNMPLPRLHRDCADRVGQTDSTGPALGRRGGTARNFNGRAEGSVTTRIIPSAVVTSIGS